MVGKEGAVALHQAQADRTVAVKQHALRAAQRGIQHCAWDGIPVLRPKENSFEVFQFQGCKHILSLARLEDLG